jgi:hypothetical protein
VRARLRESKSSWGDYAAAQLIFRYLGRTNWCGSKRVVVLDNLREGVPKPDIYDPTVNPRIVTYASITMSSHLPRRVTLNVLVGLAC